MDTCNRCGEPIAEGTRHATKEEVLASERRVPVGGLTVRTFGLQPVSDYVRVEIRDAKHLERVLRRDEPVCVPVRADEDGG